MKRIIFFCLLIMPALSFALDFSPYLGEKMTFRITWFGIHGGDAEISLEEGSYQGKKAILFKGKVESARWFSKVYYVRDYVETWIDPQSLKPFKISVDYREGKKYHRKAEYIFDYEQQKCFSSGDNKYKETVLPEKFMEMFGAFYFLRSFSFEDQNEVSSVISDGRKSYEIKAKLCESEERSTYFGEKQCLKIAPSRIMLNLGGKNQNPEDICFYLLDQPGRVPVFAEGKMKIGHIVATLVNYQKNGIGR